MTILMSIIVPVYNTENYLKHCLESLIHQTYSSLEIICVNDGSSDGSWRILEEYAKKDSRIIVINKENAGVSQARNSALNIASGQYLMFVDADDWIEKDTCERTIKKAIETGSEVILWPYISEHENTSVSKKIFDGDLEFDEYAVKEKLHRRMVGLTGEELAHPESADALCTVWGKLYKTEIIKKTNLRFIDLKEIGTYEDGLFNLYYFEHVKKAVYMNQHMYHYRRTNHSSLTSNYNGQLFGQWQNLFGIMETYIAEKQLPLVYETALQNRRALSLLGLGLNVIVSDLPVRKKIGLLQEILNSKKYREAYKKLEFRYFPMHWRVFYGCAKFRCSVGVYILLRIIKKIIT